MKKLPISSIPLWVAIAGVLLLFWWAGWNARVAQKDLEAIQGAKATLALAAPFHRQMVRLAVASTVARQRAVVALGRSDSLTRAMMGLKKALPVDTTQLVRRSLVDSLVEQAELRDSLRLVAVAGLQMALSAERQRADLAENRARDLEMQLRNVLQVADCRLLGIGFLPRCPSRNASLLLGVGVGATAVLLSR